MNHGVKYIMNLSFLFDYIFKKDSSFYSIVKYKEYYCLAKLNVSNPFEILEGFIQIKDQSNDEILANLFCYYNLEEIQVIPKTNFFNGNKTPTGYLDDLISSNLGEAAPNISIEAALNSNNTLTNNSEETCKILSEGNNFIIINVTQGNILEKVIKGKKELFCYLKENGYSVS